MPDYGPSKSLTDLVTLRAEKIVGVKDSSKPYVGLEHLASGEPILLGTAQADSSISTNSVFHRGDVLFGKLRPNLRKSLPAPFDGYCSTDILVLQPNTGFDAGFVSRVFQRDEVFDKAVRTAEGTKMPRTSWIRLREYSVYVPDADSERAAIAHILDTADQAIAKTEALIAKLKAIKQDLLAHGLDDNGELRDAAKHPEQFIDSPIGRVPKLWEVEPLGNYLIRIDQGWSPNCLQESTPAGEWGVLKTTAVMWEGYFDQENKRLPSGLSPIPAYEVVKDDVLMTRAGPNSRVGVIAWVNETQGRLMLSDKIYRLVHDDRFLAKFLALALSSSQTQTHLSRLKTGMAESQTNISQSIVRTLWILRPPLCEQDRIVRVIDKTDKRLKSEHLYYVKMKMAKNGLMQDLLTGRVRVPEQMLEKLKMGG